MSDDAEQFGSTYRIPRRRGMDPGTKRLALIAGGLGSALVVLFGVSSLSSHRNGPVPVIEADPSPVRVKPANPGGLQITGLSDEILSGDTDAGTQNDKLLPPPEAPAPQALARVENAEASPPASAAPPTPTAPPASAPPQAAPPAAQPPSSPASSASTPAQAAPEVAPAPAPRPADPGLGANRATVPPRARATTGPTPPAPATAATGTAVQLAAMASEPAARGEWERLSKRMPELLGARRPDVVESERDGHTVFRLRTGGFRDIAEATAFCERVRAKGAGCSIANF